MLSTTAPGAVPGADGDLAAVRPAAHTPAAGRSIVIGWLSRGHGAPLELITSMGGRGSQVAGSCARPSGPAVRTGPAEGATPVPGGGVVAAVPPAAGITRGKHAAPPRISVAPVPEPLLFPPGAWGLPVAGGCADDLDRLVWVPCLAVRAPGPQRPEAGSGPSLFETALVALMRRPFGWLVVAEPAGPDEGAGAREEEVAAAEGEGGGAEEGASAEEGTASGLPARDGGGTRLWSVRVLAGASGPAELDVLAPLLAGSVELGPHPFRLRADTWAGPLEEALSARRHDPGDGAQSPFLVTAGTIAVLAGLPRLGVPGLNVTGSAQHGIQRTMSPAPAVPDTPVPAEPPAVGGHDDAADPFPDQPPAAIQLGIPLDPDSAPDTLRLPVAALGRGVLVAGCDGVGPSPTIAATLGQLTGLGLPWLVVDPAGSGYEKVTSARPHLPVTVINPCAPDAVPLTISPLTPEPGYPLQAHMAMVRWLVDLSFGSDELFSQALSVALPRVYQAAGWDLVTGAAAGRAPVAPAVPALGQLHTEVIEVISRADYDRRTRARLRSLADARFGSLLNGAAGRFLHGGHPADVGELLRRNVVLAVHDIGAAEDRTFVTGALLVRLAEYLRRRTGDRPGVTSAAAPSARLGAPRPSLRHVVVIEDARILLRDHGAGRPATRAAERFAALLAEFGARGEGIVLAEQRPALLVPDVARSTAVRIVHRMAPAGGGQAWHRPLGAPEVAVMAAEQTGPPRWGRMTRPPALDPAAGPLAADVPPPVSGRRSVACGRQCREARACHLAELRESELLAASPDHAWLRVWTETFLLAFLTDNPLPAVPVPLQRRWQSLGTRSRECLLAQVIDRRVGVRAVALRVSYDPSRLAQVIASAAATRLDGAGSVGTGTGGAAAEPGAGLPPAVRPGPAWVVPQLRWLHEIERLCPLSGAAPTPADHAPPLDFDLAGLPDWPGIRVGQRVRALRRHSLSMELAANRQLAWIALAGEEGPGPLAADLGQVMPGVDHAQGLRHTAALMEVSGGAGTGPGWLEAVLSWPRRFVAFSSDTCLPGDAADCPRG